MSSIAIVNKCKPRVDLLRVCTKSSTMDHAWSEERSDVERYIQTPHMTQDTHRTIARIAYQARLMKDLGVRYPSRRNTQTYRYQSQLTYKTQKWNDGSVMDGKNKLLEEWWIWTGFQSDSGMIPGDTY